MNAILTTVEFFHRAWWLILIRGIVSILFGIAAIAWPGPTVAVTNFNVGRLVYGRRHREHGRGDHTSQCR